MCSAVHSEGTAVQQLSKVFRVYGRCPEEQTLLVQISTIPNIRFLFSQAKRWFLLRNRTPLNRLEHLGWIKKEALYDNGRNRYRYYMHSVIAAAIRAQFIDALYDLCQGFIHEITIEMTSSLSQNDATKKELIQFSWSLNDIFHGQFQSEEDSDFLWALAEIYRDIGYHTNDPFEIAAALDITVMERSDFQRQKGAFKVVLHNSFIFINAKMSDEMKRIVRPDDMYGAGILEVHP